MCHEIRDCINDIRRETRTRVLVLTGAGDRFFCIGGRKDGMEDTTLYAGVLPTLEIYEAIERLQKPVIASVNGFAVGGGQVLQVHVRPHDRQGKRRVPPGRADDGRASTRATAPGTSKTSSARRRPRRCGSSTSALTAREALESGSSTRSCPTTSSRRRRAPWRWRSPSAAPFALAALKGAFIARHGGVSGLSRISHDLLLRRYLDTDESKELAKSFAEKRKPDPGKFGH